MYARFNSQRVPRSNVTSRRNKLALIWEGEDGARRTFTYWELWVETNRLAHALRKLGVNKGDRVGIYMPMIPEVCVASLASCQALFWGFDHYSYAFLGMVLLVGGVTATPAAGPDATAASPPSSPEREAGSRKWVTM